MKPTTATGILLILATCLSDGQAFIDPVVGPGLSNCTFEVDRCEWRPYDTVYKHPMQWVVIDDDMAFTPPLKGSWFAAVEMGNFPKLTLNATFMCKLFRLDDIEELKITFNYFFWVDPRETSGSAELYLKYQMAVGGPGYPNHILEIWNVTSSAGTKWKTANVYYKPGREWLSKFWFFAKVTTTNRAKFAIDDFAVEVTKKPPTTTTALRTRTAN